MQRPDFREPRVNRPLILALIFSMGFFSRLFGAVSAADTKPVAVEPATQTVDPRTLLYSLATIENQWPATEESIPARPEDLVLHEDDWRQFEAVSTNFADVVAAELEDIRRFHSEKSTPLKLPQGEFRAFTECHVRKRVPAPVPGTVLWADLLATCGVTEGDVHRATLQGAKGVITGSYSFKVGDLTLYGLREDASVRLLCLAGTNAPALPADRAALFATFLAQNNLILVHWPSPTILQGEDVSKYLLRRGTE